MFKNFGVPVLAAGAGVAAAGALASRVKAQARSTVNSSIDIDEQRKALDKVRTGVIVLNIGSPATTSTGDVRTYLGKFLGDDRVLDIVPAWKKWIALRAILTFRPKGAAEKYNLVWDKERGSPLVYLTDDLVEGLQKKLGDDYDVRVGMSYSDPIIGDVMERFAAEGTTRVVVVPNYPNYASSTTGSSLQDVYHAASKNYVVPSLSVVPPFFTHPGFIKIWAKNIKEGIGAIPGEPGSKVDHFIFSFHGVPIRHCMGCDPSGEVCGKSPDCCDKLVGGNRDCYRAQCHETARRIAKHMGMKDGTWETSFQSRLTIRDTVKWIEPYTDVRLEDLAHSGVKRVGICSPSFSVDCLETLQELDLENREEFIGSGGEEYVYVGCPNADKEWVETLGEIIKMSAPKDLTW